MNLLPPAKLPEWDSEDAGALRAFLTSDLAQKAFAFVSDACPSLLDGSDVNMALVRSGEVKGFALALDTLFSLVNHKPEESKAPENYPDPDLPEGHPAWKDHETTK